MINISELVFERVRDFMLVFVTSNLEEIMIKIQVLWPERFPHYNYMGPFGCHGNHSFEQIHQTSYIVQSTPDNTTSGTI